ncbi:Transmembrane protein 85 [Musa troglodytarum]|uniref:ER membrane protein complex subunit 4 n=1 Tax=Musa troglodytarum TaxID=320322 RepID=A0A9E7KFI2_9LILI|nr:Transmembrane protein 85 [Musa troglodytarum]
MEKGKGLARRWAVEFAENSSYASSTSDVPDPIGFNRSASDPDDANASRQKKDAESAWKAQLEKSADENVFFCTSLSIFEPYKDSKVDILAPKLLFIALNLAALALGVWKLNTLGLLPTHASDWVSSLPPAPVRPPDSGSFFMCFHLSFVDVALERSGIFWWGPSNPLMLFAQFIVLGINSCVGCKCRHQNV